MKNFTLNGLGTAEIYLPHWVRKSVLLSNCYILFAHSKTIWFAQNFIFSRSRYLLLTFLLSHDIWMTSKIQVNFRFKCYWWFCLIIFWNFHTIYVFEVRESIADISTELPCLGDLENPGRLPVQHVLVNVSYSFSKFLDYSCFRGQGI